MFLWGAAHDADWGAMARLRAGLPGLLAEVAAHPSRFLLLLFGRFPPIRRAVAAVAMAVAPAEAASERPGGEVLTDLEAPAAVAALRRDGLCAGLFLPPAVVDEMRAYAESRAGYGGPGWRTVVPPRGAR